MLGKEYKSLLDGYSLIDFPESQDTIQHIKANILAYMYNEVVKGEKLNNCTRYYSDLGTFDIELNIRNISEGEQKKDLMDDIKENPERLDTFAEDLASVIKKIVSKL